MRRFAIEPALLPLLRTMHAEANGDGPVVAMRQQKWWGPPISANPSKPPASNASPLRNRRHSQAPTLPRPPRYGPHVDGHPRRRPAENPTARRPPHLRDDPEVHPHRRSGGRGHWRGVPTAPGEPSRWTISSTASSERLATTRKYCGGAGNRTLMRDLTTCVIHAE